MGGALWHTRGAEDGGLVGTTGLATNDTEYRERLQEQSDAQIDA